MLLPINFFTDFINNHLLALACSIPQNCSFMATAFASSSPVQKTTCHWAFNFDYHLPIPPSVLTTTIAFRRRNTTVKCSGGAYDVIIVGAGVTGSALAHTLAKVREMSIYINHKWIDWLQYVDTIKLLC